MPPVNLDAYLRRIGCERPRNASLESLRAIAFAHATTIPFENLSVLASGPPDLSIEAVLDKLVARGRGGYCYEQNRLLYAALEALGFDAVPLSARVRYALPRDVPTPRSHMVLCVRCGGRRWLVDAGFGRLTLTAPVDIDARDAQPTPHETVRIVPLDDALLLQFAIGGEWRDGYAFDFVPQLAVDYAQQNWYTATRPGALFATNLVVARPSRDGRRTLFNRTLTWRGAAGEETRTDVASIETLAQVLDDAFALRPAHDELEAAWAASGRGNDAHAMFV
jgi:N-hydroxyarylamine O-acetyltransferase